MEEAALRSVGVTIPKSKSILVHDVDSNHTPIMFRLSKSIFSYLSAQRRWQLALVSLLMVIGALAEVVTLGAVVPFLSLLVSPELAEKSVWVSSILNHIEESLGVTRLAAASLVFAMLAFVAAAIRLTLTWASYKAVFDIGADLGALIFNRVLNQPYRYHIEKNSSETLSAVEKVGHLTAGVLAPLMQLGVSVVMVGAILSAMLWISPWVALTTGFIVGSLYISISLLTKKKLIENSKKIAVNSTSRIQYLQEGLGAIRDIVLEQSQPVYVGQFSTVDRIVRNAQATNATLAHAPKYLVESFSIILVVVIANWLINQPGGISEALPILGALALGGQRMLPHVQMIYNGYASYRGSLASSLETLSVLGLPEGNQMRDLNATNDVDYFGGQLRSVSLRGVSYSYGVSGVFVLKDINLEISCGDRIGIVGKTGGGKSTFLDLCMGLLTPSEGEILVNDILLDEKNLQFWQRRVAHVPQFIFLCDKSIAENIALGQTLSEIDVDKLNDSIKVAQLEEFIKQLPQGVSTRVGERGVQLSGGQRQRVGIARALYKNSDVLVLDEATSALDSATEKLVMESIYRLNPNKIIIMIAHRLSTLEQCSAIYRVQDCMLTAEDPGRSNDVVA